MKRFLLFVIYYLSTWTANAQEGTWYGKLDIQGTILPVVFHFSDDDVPWILRLKGQKAE